MKRTFLIGVLSLALLFVFSGTSFAQFGSISGRVTDDSTGLPIMGAHVWAKADTTQPGGYGFGFTDSSGFYVIDSLYAGEFLVFANAQDYVEEVYPESVIVLAGQTTPNIDFALTPTGIPEYGSISGRVTDQDTGFPIVGARLVATGVDTYCFGEAWSDSDGYYILEDLCVGIWQVHASKPGYYPQIYPDTVTVVEGQTTPDIDFALTPFSSPGFGSISGRVTDEVTGYPIPGAAITLGEIYGVWYTDSAGHYVCDSIPVGGYWVTAYATGYQEETYPESVIVFEGENTPDIDFALAPTGSPEYGSISGRVTDQVTGLPIIGAHLLATGLDTYCFGEAWSDSSGYYIIEDLCVGIWQVQASKPGYHTQIYPDTVSVVEGQTTPDIDFALTPAGEMGSISGRVTDEATGIGLPMAHVLVYDSTHLAGHAWTDTAGLYLVQDLRAGQYIVAVQKDGYEDEVYPESVIVNEGQNTPNIDFALTALIRNGSISGRVIDQNTSLPIIGAHLLATGVDMYCFGEAWSDSNGHYIIEDLCAGLWRMQASKPGYYTELYPESVTVVEGQTTSGIDFALIPSGPTEFGSISGRVTDQETGLPIIMAQITITGLSYIWYSDTSGYYFCDSLAPGGYFVNAHKEGYHPRTYPDSVIVMAGENTQHIDFALSRAAELGSISGMVTDKDTGLPVVMAHLVATGLDNFCFAEAWSDTAGLYAMQDVCPGIYSVTASHEGYAQETYPESVFVVAGENTTGIDFALTPVVYGDADGNGEVHLADVVYLINYLLRQGPAPPYPLESSDVNCDQWLDLSDVVFLIAYLFKGGPEPSCYPTGRVTDFTGCKTFHTGTYTDGITPDQDCIEYDYDGESVLLLKHVNGAFNCCPDDILADVTVAGNLILIQESEYLVTPCDCLCLFDVDVRISSLDPGQYTIKVMGLYLDPDDEPLEFTIDLSSSPSSGTYCVERDHYPWGGGMRLSK